MINKISGSFMMLLGFVSTCYFVLVKDGFFVAFLTGGVFLLGVCVFIGSEAVFTIASQISDDEE